MNRCSTNNLTSQQAAGTQREILDQQLTKEQAAKNAKQAQIDHSLLSVSNSTRSGGG
jgi:hypothetical protein